MNYVNENNTLTIMQNNYHLIRFIAASLVLYGHSYPLIGCGNNDYLTIASRGIFPTSHMGVCIFS